MMLSQIRNALKPPFYTLIWLSTQFLSLKHKLVPFLLLEVQ